MLIEFSKNRSYVFTGQTGVCGLSVVPPDCVGPEKLFRTWNQKQLNWRYLFENIDNSIWRQSTEWVSSKSGAPPLCPAQFEPRSKESCIFA